MKLYRTEIYFLVLITMACALTILESLYMIFSADIIMQILGYLIALCAGAALQILWEYIQFLRGIQR